MNNKSGLFSAVIDALAINGGLVVYPNFGGKKGGVYCHEKGHSALRDRRKMERYNKRKGRLNNKK